MRPTRCGSRRRGCVRPRTPGRGSATRACAWPGRRGPGDRILRERAAAARAVHDLEPDLLEAVEDPARGPRSGVSPSIGSTSNGCGPIAGRADHPGRLRRGRHDVAADTDRVLAVEHTLGGHRAEAPDEPREHLRLEAAEALLLLERLMVTERAAAHADREPRRLRPLQVGVTGGGVTRLVDRDGPVSFCTYSTPTAVPASSVVIASTRSSQANCSRPEWCAIVSAIDVTCSIIAGE